MKCNYNRIKTKTIVLKEPNREDTGKQTFVLSVLANSEGMARIIGVKEANTPAVMVFTERRIVGAMFDDDEKVDPIGDRIKQYLETGCPCFVDVLPIASENTIEAWRKFGKENGAIFDEMAGYALSLRFVPKGGEKV